MLMATLSAHLVRSLPRSRAAFPSSFSSSSSSYLRVTRSTVPRAYTSETTRPGGPSPATTRPSQAQSLAAEVLAQRTGSQSLASKTAPTAPKGNKRPSKAPGQTQSNWREWAIGSGLVTGLLGSGLAYFGRPFDDGREDKYVNNNLTLAAFHRARDRWNELHSSLTNPIWDKILPEPLPDPYQRPFTLVINLDETLIYSTWDKEHGWRHAKRPGIDYFLAYLSQFYEIVVFTSQSAMNVNPILDKLDPYQCIMYRVYREACRQVDGKLVKDLSHLNRDLSKVIIMDSNPDSYALQPENAIPLKPWKGEPNDRGLLDYVPFLEGGSIALTNVEDIRPVLQSFSGRDIPHEWALRERIMNESIKKQWEEEHAQRKHKKGLASLLGHGSPAEEQGPPPSYLDQVRRQYREQFANEHDEMRKAAEEQMKNNLEEQQRQMKEMRLTVWQLLTNVSQ
ncbi:HAD-like domain-containing protein, partial [Jimgerdemannia flammicorona]